jgi:hypothetical protein
MIYKIINSSGNKFQRAVLNIFIILSYLTTFSSCMTTYESWEIPGTMNQTNSNEIKKIELKDGTMIDCKDKILKFENAGDSGKYIVVKSYTVGKNFQTFWTEKRIPEKDIYKFYIDKSEASGSTTTLLVIGVVVIVVIVFLVALGQSFKNMNLGTW